MLWSQPTLLLTTYYLRDDRAPPHLPGFNKSTVPTTVSTFLPLPSIPSPPQLSLLSAQAYPPQKLAVRRSLLAAFLVGQDFVNPTSEIQFTCPTLLLSPHRVHTSSLINLRFPPSMAFFTAPRSLQNAASLVPRDVLLTQAQMGVNMVQDGQPPHSSHPSFFHLVLLVFEAVLEVICVSLPGYIAAKQGMFDAEAQKLVANLNVFLFTPCLSALLTTWVLRSRADCLYSLYQAWIPAHRGEIDRSRHYSIDLRRPDVCLVLLRLVGVAMFPLQETTGKFCGSDGCRISSP